MKVSVNSVLVMCLGTGAALTGVAAHAAEPAEGRAYVEIGYTQLDWSEGSVSLKPGNALVRVGYEMTKNLAFEVLGAAGTSSDTLQGVAFKVKSAYGAYLKGQFEVAPRFELFARAGLLHATFSGSAFGVTASTSDNSFSYGLGAQYHFTNNWYLQGDYASYFDKGGDKITGPSLSVGYRF